MPNIPRLVALAAASLALAGCVSLQHAPIRKIGGEHILVSNYGWYLFHFIPLACGNANEDRVAPWVLFRDDVLMDKLQTRFMDYAHARGLETEDLVYKAKESVMFEIPGINLPLPVPYFLTYREIQLSGVLVPPEAMVEVSK